MLSFRIYSEIVMLQFGIVIVINCPNCGSIWQVLGSYIKNKFSHIIIFINFSFFKSWHNVIISIMWSVLGASSYSPAIMTFFVVSHVSIRTHLALPHYVVCMGAWYGFWLFFFFFFLMLACQKWKFNDSFEIGGLHVMFVWATSEGFFSYGG